MNDIIEKLDKAMDDMIDLERDAMNVNNIKDKNYYRGAFNGLCFAKHLLMDTETKKTEREKGCQFCCYQEYPDETLYPRENEGYILYAGYCKQIDVDDFEEKEAGKIKFCPVCGRKLEETRNRKDK